MVKRDNKVIRLHKYMMWESLCWETQPSVKKAHWNRAKKQYLEHEEKSIKKDES